MRLFKTGEGLPLSLSKVTEFLLGELFTLPASEASEGTPNVTDAAMKLSRWLDLTLHEDVWADGCRVFLEDTIGNLKFRR